MAERSAFVVGDAEAVNHQHHKASQNYDIEDETEDETKDETKAGADVTKDEPIADVFNHDRFPIRLSKRVKFPDFGV